MDRADSPGEDRLFCAIVAGTAEASVVREDERTLAFMDGNPVTPGHLPPIPRCYAPFLADLDAIPRRIREVNRR